jgi:hypothetical protein
MPFNKVILRDSIPLTISLICIVKFNCKVYIIGAAIQIYSLRESRSTRGIIVLIFYACWSTNALPHACVLQRVGQARKTVRCRLATCLRVPKSNLARVWDERALAATVAPTAAASTYVHQRPN